MDIPHLPAAKRISLAFCFERAIKEILIPLAKQVSLLRLRRPRSVRCGSNNPFYIPIAGLILGAAAALPTKTLTEALKTRDWGKWMKSLSAP